MLSLVSFSAGWGLMYAMGIKCTCTCMLVSVDLIHIFQGHWPEKVATMYLRADSRFVPSQWETALLCNAVSHWLGTNLSLGGCNPVFASWLGKQSWRISAHEIHQSITRNCKQEQKETKAQNREYLMTSGPILHNMHINICNYTHVHVHSHPHSVY